MAVIFADGFDHYGNRNPVAFRKWDVTSVAANVGGIVATAAPPVKNGTHSLKIPSGQFIYTNKFGPFTGVIVGFWIYFPSLPSTGFDLIQVLNNDLRHISLRVNPTSRRFEVRGENDVSMAQGTTVVGVNTWYHIEFRVGLSRGSGTCRFRVNMKTEINFSSADTAHSDDPDSVWNRVVLAGVVGNAATVIDDFYLSNLDGPAPYNNFLGMARIETILPQTDAADGRAGLHGDFEVYPFGEADHGKQVDEIIPSSFDFNFAPQHLLDTEDDFFLDETYHYPNMQPLQVVEIDGVPTPERIMGVQSNLYIQRDYANVMHIRHIINSGSGDIFGPEMEVEEFWKYFTQIFQSNPNGNVEWTEAAVNAVIVGLRAFDPSNLPPL